MSRSRDRRAAWIVALVLAVLAAACGGTPEDPSAEGEETATGDTADGTGGEDDGEAAGNGDPIRIGISMPLTGDFSEPGKGIQEGYEVWAADVNGQGGLLGREVELLFRDDGSDPKLFVLPCSSRMPPRIGPC